MDGRSANTYLAAIEKHKNHANELAAIEKQYLAKVEGALSREKIQKNFKEVKLALPDGGELSITADDAYKVGQKVIDRLKAELDQQLTIAGFDQRFFIIVDTITYVTNLMKEFDRQLKDIKQYQDLISALIATITQSLKQAKDLITNGNSGLSKKEIAKLLEDESKKLGKIKEEQSKKKLDQLPSIIPIRDILSSLFQANQDLLAFLDTNILKNPEINEETKWELMNLTSRCAKIVESDCLTLKAHKESIAQMQATKTTQDAQVQEIQSEVNTTLSSLKTFDPKKVAKKPMLAAVPTPSQLTAATGSTAKQLAPALPALTTVPADDNLIRFFKVAAWVQNELASFNQTIDENYKEYVLAVKAAGVSVESVEKKGLALLANIDKFFELIRLQKACQLDVIPSQGSQPLLSVSENLNAQMAKFKTEFANAMKTRDPKLIDKLHAAFKEIFRTSENSRSLDPDFKDSPKLKLFAQNQEKIKTDLPKMVERAGKVRTSLIMLNSSLKDMIDNQVKTFSEVVGFVNGALQPKLTTKSSSPTTTKPTRSPQRSPLASQGITGTTFKRAGGQPAGVKPLPEVGASGVPRFGTTGSQ